MKRYRVYLDVQAEGVADALWKVLEIAKDYWHAMIEGYSDMDEDAPLSVAEITDKGDVLCTVHEAEGGEDQ